MGFLVGSGCKWAWWCRDFVVSPDLLTPAQLWAHPPSDNQAIVGGDQQKRFDFKRSTKKAFLFFDFSGEVRFFADSFWHLVACEGPGHRSLTSEGS